MAKQKHIALDFEVDKLTNSIENTLTGESYPIEVDFTVLSKAWTTEEEREFSELIKEQRKTYNQKQVPFSPARRMPTTFRRKKELA